MNLCQRAFIRCHVSAYRLSGGRVGAKLGGLDHLLLTTTGRRTGRRRTRALACLRSGDDRVVVASNGGSDRDPAWFHNLRVNPAVEVQLGARREGRVAQLAGAAERARLWPQLLQFNPAYRAYQSRTRREIPVILLRRPG
jgi:deazaflavin-dependent oxidoreductase (nitroreductase family)